MRYSARGLRLTALSLCLFASIATGSATPRNFEWSAPLEGDLEEGQVYRLRIPGEVYERCRKFPDDLRIIDAEGRQLPFFLWRSSDADRIENLDSTRLNLARAEGDIAYWRQDLQVSPRADGSRPRHNRLVVGSSGNEFIRRVEVLGSERGDEWSLLAAGFLVRMRRPSNIHNNTINYADSDFPHLQVRVYPSAMEALETFALHDVRLAHSSRAEVRYDPVPVAQLEPRPKDRNTDAQVVILDAKHIRIPIERLIFDVGQTEFARAVRVYGRNIETEDWRYIASADIYSLSGSVNDQVAFRGSRNRYLKVELYHYDDSPLDLLAIEAEGSARNLVFEARSTNRPALYYGSEFMRPPRFDLRRRLEGVDISGIDLAQIGAAAVNPAYRPHGFGRWGPWLSGLLVAIVSLAVVRVIVDMMKKQKDADCTNSAR